MKYYRAISLFLRLVGGLTKPSESKPTTWQWLYEWRISPKTALSISKEIWL